MHEADRAVCVGVHLQNTPAQRLASSLEELAPYHRDRSIEAWLLGADGRLLGCAVNSSGRNRTLHAEMNLLHFWWQRARKPLPARARIVTTLEPCPMCAGAIWECIEEREYFLVQYLQPDLGTVVRRSVLRGTRILEHCKNIEQDLNPQVIESTKL
jgi:tRNA(Arg) A34 adenosine deaminase TadA